MLTVLIIETDERIRNTIAGWLFEKGLIAMVSEGGASAQALVRELRPALIVTNLLMPRMDGIEIIRMVRAESPTLPIIAMTGESRLPKEYLLETAKALGADAVLTKPITRSALLEAIEYCLGARSLGGI
jgi:CheY-like chemotaxis protein